MCRRPGRAHADGKLRLLSTTPAPPPWLLAAQVIINVALAQHIGNYSPLGAAVQAMDSAIQGSFPPVRRCW